jgi:hypothetical protein
MSVMTLKKTPINLKLSPEYISSVTGITEGSALPLAGPLP